MTNMRFLYPFFYIKPKTNKSYRAYEEPPPQIPYFMKILNSI